MTADHYGSGGSKSVTDTGSSAVGKESVCDWQWDAPWDHLGCNGACQTGLDLVPADARIPQYSTWNNEVTCSDDNLHCLCSQRQQPTTWNNTVNFHHYSPDDIYDHNTPNHQWIDAGGLDLLDGNAQHGTHEWYDDELDSTKKKQGDGEHHEKYYRTEFKDNRRTARETNVVQYWQSPFRRDSLVLHLLDCRSDVNQIGYCYRLPCGTKANDGEQYGCPQGFGDIQPQLDCVNAD